MSAIDDIHEDMYWRKIAQGMILLTKLIKAHEQADFAAAHRRREKHWRSRIASALYRLADKLTLVERG